MRNVRIATAASLAGIAVLHAAWGRGSSFPFTSRPQLSDSMSGRPTAPSPAACYGVAGLLTAASALVAGLPSRHTFVRHAGVCTVAAVLGIRAVLGFTGRTDLVSPGSVSPRFRQMDVRFYSPLCLALALGAASSLRDKK